MNILARTGKGGSFDPNMGMFESHSCYLHTTGKPGPGFGNTLSLWKGVKMGKWQALKILKNSKDPAI